MTGPGSTISTTTCWRMDIRPFVELGFTPEALKTSDQTHLLLEGQHLASASRTAGRDLIDAFVRHLDRALRRGGSAQLVLRGLERAESGRLLGRRRPGRLFRSSTTSPRAPSRRSIPICGSAARRPRARRGCPEFLAHVAQARRAGRFRHHPYLRRRWRLSRRERQERHQALAVARRDRRRRAQGARADRRRRPSRACRSISPNGAPAIRRATPCTTRYISAPYILTKLKASRGPGPGHELLDLSATCSRSRGRRPRRSRAASA